MNAEDKRGNDEAVTELARRQVQSEKGDEQEAAIGECEGKG